jgi:sugar phosphate isomerase/epimerase
MAVQLSLSNLCFPPDTLVSAMPLLTELGVTGIEVAPYTVFGSWDVPASEIREFRARLDGAGLACPAMQGIVFNANDAHLFASVESREMLYRHLVHVAQMAGFLGAKACVFGAPKVRDPGDLAPAQARAIAINFLRQIGPVFAAEGSALAFEPNARHYACRFVTTTLEGIELVSETRAPGIGLQIDTGTVLLEGEDPVVLSSAAAHAVHAHISEPNLAPIGSSGVNHAPLADALRKGRYHGWMSIEMRSVPEWRSAVRRAVAVARENYVR